MGVKREPVVAADYQPGVSRLVRQTCLEVATRLGDFRDQLCIVGGLVPSLLIPQSQLRAGEESHVGTIDLDLGFSMVVLDNALYEEIAKRLGEAGFAPDVNEAGNPTAQRWRSPEGVTVDFLIPPVSQEDEGGKLRHLESNLAAFIIPGLELAFVDSELVTIEDELPSGGKAVREVRVCGPAAFTVLKTLAFDKRGKPKDAYDLYYMLRHHSLGARRIGARVAGFRPHAQVDQMVQVLKRDFVDAELVGPVRVATFLGGPDADVQADAAGFVRELLDGLANA